MSKIRLNLDDLEVSSFETMTANDMPAIGTVRARADFIEADAAGTVQTAVYTCCGSCNTPGTCSQCVSCDPSYCNTECPNCRALEQ